MAGQFAKPRSSDTETRGDVTLPAYRGDIVNGFDFTDGVARAPTRAGCCKGYHTAASTLNLIRAFTQGGFADLREVHCWNKGFAENPANQRYERLAREIDRAIKFMEAAGADFDELRRVEFYTGHEGLLMDYERPMTRIDSRTGTPYNTSAHFLWIGERTRDLDGAHVDYFSKIRNPIGVKLGPSTTPETLLELIDKLDPEPRARPADLHHAHGRGQDPRRAAAAARGRHATRARPRCGSPTRCTATASRRRPATRPVASTTSSTRCAGFFEAHRAVGTLPRRHPRRAHRRRRHRVPRRLGADRRGDPRDALRVAVRPAPEPHAVARARVPGGRGARPPAERASSRGVRCTDAPRQPPASVSRS